MSSTFSTTDPRVRQISPITWIDGNDRYVFEVQDGKINVFNLRHTSDEKINEEPYDTLDAAITAYLGAAA